MNEGEAEMNGGEKGIRTLGTVSRTHAFQACSLNHSDISPSLKSTTCERRAEDYRTRRLQVARVCRLRRRRPTSREGGPASRSAVFRRDESPAAHARNSVLLELGQ